MLRIGLKNKKGDGLSLNIIVIAVVALLILVILAVIVLRGTGNFSKGVNSCDGGCIFEGDSCNPGYVKVPSSCSVTPNGPKGQYCCTNIDATN